MIVKFINVPIILPYTICSKKLQQKLLTFIFYFKQLKEIYCFSLQLENAYDCVCCIRILPGKSIFSLCLRIDKLYVFPIFNKISPPFRTFYHFFVVHRKTMFLTIIKTFIVKKLCLSLCLGIQYYNNLTRNLSYFLI